MKKIKQLITVLLTVFFSLSLFACDASVNIYHQEYDGKDLAFLEVVLSQQTENAIHMDAANDMAGATYTLRRYFDYFIKESGDANGAQVSRKSVEGNSYYVFSFPENSAPPFLSELLSRDYTPVVNKGFFIHTVDIEKINPFSGLYADFEKKENEKRDFISPLGILACGKRVYVSGDMTGQPTYKYDEALGKWYVEKLPPIKQVFPALKNMNEKLLTFNYFMSGSVKMVSSGTRVLTDDGIFYLWSIKPDADGVVAYRYFRANSTGWLILSLILGGAAVGLVFLICHLRKKNKNKNAASSVKDLYPYDPNDPFN